MYKLFELQFSYQNPFLLPGLLGFFVLFTIKGCLNKSLHFGRKLGSFCTNNSMKLRASSGMFTGYSIFVLSTYITNKLHLLSFTLCLSFSHLKMAPVLSSARMPALRCTTYLLLCCNFFSPGSMGEHNQMFHSKQFLMIQRKLTIQNHITLLLFRQSRQCFMA